MILVKYVILGIIQGFCEVLPISSSGHLKIFKSIFKSDVLNDMNFEIIVNFGSFIAIFIIYRNEIIKIIKDFFLYIHTKSDKYKPNFRYSLLIIISTIPAAIFGISIKDLIEKYFTVKVVGLMLILTAIFLYSIKDKKGYKSKSDISFIDAIKIGILQVFALIPGISRSGITIFGALNCDIESSTSVDYSFMLYLPISIASFILSISSIKLNMLYVISMLISLITTYISAKLLMKIIKKSKLIYFSIYCLIIGLLTFLFN